MPSSPCRVGGTLMLLAALTMASLTQSPEASGDCRAPRGTSSTPAPCSDESRVVLSQVPAAGGLVRVSMHAHSVGNGVDLLAARPTTPPASRGAMSASRSRARGPATLPTRWCGRERSSDNVRHAVSRAPQVKVVYAYPRGAPNRFHTYKDLMQQDVGAARALVSSASGGRRTIRFDMGTDCRGGGSEYVDIQSIALPHDAAYYGQDAKFAAELLAADLNPRLRLRGPRNVTTYVDGVTPGNTTGVASQPLDETPGADNDANRGGQRAFVFGDGSPEFGIHRTRSFMHETTHNLGAVQDGAPNATGLGHCFDREDVMCYGDGGRPAAGAWADAVCPGGARFDCGANDYFAPRPARGSYLARHWNLFDSDFMCAAPACTDSSPGSIRRALAAALRSAARALRRRGLEGLVRDGALRVRLRSPAAGRLRLVLAASGRPLARGERTFAVAGPGVLRARVLTAAHPLRRSRRLRIAVRLTFEDAGRNFARRSSVLVP